MGTRLVEVEDAHQTGDSLEVRTLKIGVELWQIRRRTEIPVHLLAALTSTFFAADAEVDAAIDSEVGIGVQDRIATRTVGTLPNGNKVFLDNFVSLSQNLNGRDLGRFVPQGVANTLVDVDDLNVVWVLTLVSVIVRPSDELALVGRIDHGGKGDFDDVGINRHARAVGVFLNLWPGGVFDLRLFDKRLLDFGCVEHSKV